MDNPNPANLPEERWRPVPGYEGLYEVSDYGRVRRGSPGLGGARAGRVLHQVRIKKGYWTVKLCHDGTTRRRRVHRLVAGAFLGPPSPGHECNHKDGDKNNNHLCNLEWVTSQQNREHAQRMGLISTARGEDSGMAKVTEAQVREIRRLYGFESHRATADRFGLTRNHVRDIRRGEYWRHLDG